MLFLSIRPQYVDAILSGTKCFELRKRMPRCSVGNQVAIYATSPEMSLRGIVTITSLTEGRPEEIWGLVSGKAGLLREDFDAYFANCRRAIAIGISDPVQLNPHIGLTELRRAWNGFQPPQEFRYLSESELSSLPQLGLTPS